MFARIKDSISPSDNKWRAFIPVENGKVVRYCLAPSEWVYEVTKKKAIDYLGIDKNGSITGIAKGGEHKGELYTWRSLGVVGIYMKDLEGHCNGLDSIKKVLD